MTTSLTAIPGSLRALLAHLIDYAGLYPPAALPLPKALENYESYLASPDSWMLNRLVLPAAKLPETAFGENWRVSLLVESEPGRLAPQIEALETKGERRLSLPTYCEAPVASINEAFAKVRTGGLTADAIPSPAVIAEFLSTAAARRMPFKATAGLHHPIRSARALTYAADSPCATMHGFVNVFTAAALAWKGAGSSKLTNVLEETDPSNFAFTNEAMRWRDTALLTDEIATARRDFAHSFGSCSFTEPLADLRALGWLD